MEKQFTEKNAHEKNGWAMVAVVIAMVLASIALIVVGIVLSPEDMNPLAALTFLGIALLIVSCVMLAGFKLLQPNEAYVLTLFGKYYGTLRKEGFFWVNPFCVSVNPARGMK